jgi:hypothetical protein
MSIDRPTYLPGTSDIHAAFAEEIESLSGRVTHTYDDGTHLFARAVLPANAEIRPGDRVRGGVAVHAGGSCIEVYPYTFRLICSNGAIAAQALEGMRLERVQGTDVVAPSYDVAVVSSELRLAVRTCAAPTAFASTTRQMRAATETEADVALNLMPFLASQPPAMAQRWLARILRQFALAGDGSVFGMMNAVTAVARDVRDEKIRWHLEALGGSIPARLEPKPKVVPPAMALAATDSAARR